MTGTVAAAPKNAGKIAAQHNEILRAAYDRVDLSLERRLADVIQPILERAGQRAAAAFARHATHHLTAAALRDADRDALLRTPFYDGPGGLGFRLRPNVLTASAPSPNATMVCVKPRPDEAAILTVPGGEPAETLHVTLAPLGETDGDLEEIRAALAAVAATHGPLDGVVGGVGRFQPPGVAILLPDVPGLVELRVAVTEALAGAQVDYARDHGFEAHISVDAAPDPATLEEALARTAQRPLHFDALLVVRGDEIVHELPLVGVLPITAAGGNPGWTAPAGDEILDVDSLVAEIRKKTDPVRTALVEAAMTPSLKAAGISFDVTNPLTAKVLAQSGSQIRGIAETTQLNVMRIIGRAYGNGLSIPQTSALIRQGMADASRTRATTIARCLPGETLVSGAMVRAVTRRWYEGDMVVLLTEAGREFTATPNHPMLTASGWQPAGNVDVGQDLICYGGEQNTCAAGNEDVAGGPTSIAEIFEAAAAVGVVERRYGGEPDFHGDGRDGEVDIARPDGPLTVGRFAALYEHLREEVFAPSDVIDGPGFCAYCGHLLAVDKSRCLCGASSMDVRFAQDARDECAGYSEVCGDSLNRHSAAVAGDDVGHVDVFASRGGGAAVLEVVGASLTRGATLDTGCVKPIEDGALVNSNGVGDLRGAQAADVERDRVIAHRRVSFSGYVFNLVTPHGYFTVNGGYTGNTELAAAANGGSLAAAQLVSGSTDGPPLYKQWLCVAPWTRVAGAGVLAVVRKPYEGELVTISARPAGRLGDAAPALRSFTVTPDHLVLTRRGWVPAGLVDEGDEVVGGIFAEHDASGQPDVDDVQPTIAQVFDTASERLSAVGMMSVPVYLDGGRLGEKVDVVATNGCLMSDLDATLSEPLRELALTLSDVGFDELLRGCASSDGLLRHGGSESGGVPETALLSESVGVAEVAERVGLTLRSDPDTVRDEDATDGAFASTETARERLQRLAGLVRFDDVISVERREWAGHVYDLTTLSGWFFADGYVAHNTAPGAPHPRHEDYDGLDGQTVALDADFDVGGNAFQYPGDPDGAPEDAINCRCVAPETLVQGRLRAASRRMYEGETIRLSTAGGRDLTVSPNHPILTRRGWVPAGLLQKGDDLICRRRKNLTGIPDVEDVPAEADERFTALQLTSSRSKRIPALRVNFHGEIPVGEVEVVMADDFLPRKAQTALEQHLCEISLALAEREVSLYTDAPSLIRISEPEAVSGTRVPYRQSSPFDKKGYGSSFDANGSTDREDALPFLVAPDHLRRDSTVASIERTAVDISVGAPDAAFPQAFPDGHHRDASLTADLLITHASEVEADPLINVVRLPFYGYLFNFSTASGTYEANGILVANCALAYTEEPPEDITGGSPGAGLDDGGISTDGTAALDEAMPLTPPPGDDVSVMAGPFVPADYVARIKENGLDVPLVDLKPTTTLGRDVFAQAPTTEGLFKAGGHWTEERTALHDQIVAGHFEGRAAPTLTDGEKPTAIFTAGGSASGKGSTILDIGGRSFPLSDLERDAERIAAGETPKYPDVILMNPDLIKEMLPEYERLKDANDLYAASGVHEESSEIGKTVARLAQEQGFNVVMDTTGASGSFVGKLEQAVKDGYDVKVRMVSAPTNEAIVRAIDRGDKTGRFVSIQALKNAHRGASAQLAIWQDNPLVTDWKLVDTRAGEANTLVAEGVGGKVTIYDQQKWDEIIAKANETSAVPGTTFGRQG